MNHQGAYGTPAALSIFIGNLKSARLSVRRLTHTLHFPSRHPDLYDVPRPEWFGSIRKALPNLQSLIVSGLSFFDHQALYALGSKALNPSPSHYSLRLLDASSCVNTTSSSLTKALACFSNLVYLDLSRCTGIRDPAVMFQLQAMPDLQVLKLQRCNLRDLDISKVVTSIGLRVRSLDLTGNALSNHSAHHLVVSGILHNRSNEFLGATHSLNSSVVTERWTDLPVSTSRPDPAIMQEFCDECLNERFVERLTNRIVNRLPSQDMPHTGITHLYVSDNQLDARGISLLLRSSKLHVLDAGKLSFSRFCISQGIVPSLRSSASEMTFLRLPHTIVTRGVPCVKQMKPAKSPEIEGMNRTDLSQTASIPPTFPIEIDDPAPRYELHDFQPPLNGPATYNEVQHLNSAATNDNSDISAKDDAGELCLLPSMVPKLRTLVLTHLPSHEKSSVKSPLSESLIHFIEACAQAAEAARQRELHHSGPSSKAGRGRHRSPTPPSFALRRIVLELDAPSQTSGILDATELPVSALQPNLDSARRTLSSTEDQDSENFWVAAQKDYSFFGDEERVKHAKRDLKGMQQTQDGSSQQQRDSRQTLPGGKDVVHEIAKFRQERKIAYECGLNEGRAFTEGYWHGEIKVVRHVG